MAPLRQKRPIRDGRLPTPLQTLRRDRGDWRADQRIATEHQLKLMGKGGVEGGVKHALLRFTL